SRRSLPRSRCTTASCRRPSTTRRPIPTAISTTCRTRRASRTWRWRSRTRSGSAAPTPRSPSASIAADSSPVVNAAELGALEERLGHRFVDFSLVTRALTHASYANEHHPSEDQEPLAFLGDAALALAVAERLIAADPGAPVGVLTPRRAEIVSGANLARWAT